MFKPLIHKSLSHLDTYRGDIKKTHGRYDVNELAAPPTDHVRKVMRSPFAVMARRTANNSPRQQLFIPDYAKHTESHYIWSDSMDDSNHGQALRHARLMMEAADDREFTARRAYHIAAVEADEPAENTASEYQNERHEYNVAYGNKAMVVLRMCGLMLTI
jgi:hypothetical protein